MTARAPAQAVVLLLTAASVSFAQAREPIGRAVADVRGVSAGVPADPGWVVAVPSGTVVPTRGLGIEAAAHVYVLRWGSAALGVGASWLSGRASTTPLEPEPGTTPPPVETPEMTTRVTLLAPQVSLNFGHAMGWSYVSAGLGGASVVSDAALPSGTASASLESGWVKALNFGGGARWFITDHIGVGFDLRWHKISLLAATPTHPGAPRASLFVAGAGVVFK